jgi:uncharacterized FlgJ-related protein
MRKNHLFKLTLFIMLSTVIIRNGMAQTKNSALIDSIACYICASEIAHKEIVMHQAMLESGWATSKFLMSRQNLFGFRSKKYLSFTHWKESVDYYSRWQSKRYTNPNEDYYQFLERIKYGAPGYSAKLKKMKYSLKCPCTSK